MIVFDTDILIDASRNVPMAVRTLSQFQQGGQLAVSAMTQMELLVGCQNNRALAQTSAFLQRFTILPIDHAISDVTVTLLTKYTLSHGLKTPDALIAATALHHALPLLSKNQRDYRFITGLNLLPYPLPASEG
jgi:predicted nucleic acid-binding protein